jgi:diguanylate cyclase (GGDEF)-like protein
MKQATVTILEAPGLSGMSAPPTTARELHDLRLENARLRRAVAELQGYRTLACHDALTGLWNRRYFDERLSEEMSLARRRNGRRLSLLVLDLDDLKLINDRQGHAAGDQALKRTATFLKSRLREHDVCCRLGGDEFAIILRELGPAECELLMSRLRRELEASNTRRGLLGVSRLSMGAASYPDEAATARDLYLRSDQAMYADKRRAKGLQSME